MANEVRITDGSLDFSQGVNDSKVTTVASPVANPNGTLRTELCWLNNGTVRGNGISPRPGWSYLCTVSKTGAIYQGGYLYEPLIGNPYLMLSVGGHIFQVRVDTNNTVVDVTQGLTNPSTVPQAYFAQAEQFLIIQAGDWQVNIKGTPPLFWDGAKMTRSVGIISANNTPNGGIIPFNQIPPALAMIYYQGRLWYSNGRTFAAGDIVGGSAGTPTYQLTDSVLYVTENPLAVGGDGFTVPSQAGQVTALNYTASLDQTLGQGPLYIFTRKQIYQLVVPVTRADWIAATNSNQPQQTLAQKRYGATSDRGVFAVNGDLFYGSPEPSMRSLILATRWFQQWANVSIGRAVQRAFKFTTPTLLGTQTGIEFSNRALLGVLPVVTPVGVAFQGIVALDFDIISTLGQKLPPAYDGLWDGLDVLQLFEGDFGGLQRAFAVVHSRTDGSIQVWELTQTALRDGTDNRIQWRIEFPAYTFGDEFKLKKLDGGELWLDKVQGSVELLFEFRVDADACWQPWMETQFCSARNTCETVMNPICYPVQPFCDGEKFPVTLPAPNVGDGVQANLRPGNIGYQFQVRLTILGSCRVRGILLYALPHERRPFEGLRHSSTPVQPAGQQFPNTAQAVTVQCPDGTPFTYQVPAGMFLAASVAAANQQAIQYGEQQANLRLICLSPLSNPIAISGLPYTGTITATGGQLATGAQRNTWVLTGFIPVDLVFNGGFIPASQVSITGTPVDSDIGSYPFSVTITDPQGNTATKEYTLTVEAGPLPPVQLFNPELNDLSWSSRVQPASWQLFQTDPPPGGKVATFAGNLASQTNAMPSYGTYYIVGVNSLGVPVTLPSNSVIYAPGYLLVPDQIVSPTNPGGIGYTTTLFGPVNGKVYDLDANSSGQPIWTSTDGGLTWTNLNSNYHLVSLNGPVGGVFGNNIFLIAQAGGGVATSTDGITWTNRPAASAIPFLAICFGNGFFVGVGNNGTAAVSADGINWTTSFIGQPFSFDGVCAGNGIFVAVGIVGFLYTSTNGLVWTQQNSNTAVQLEAVCYSAPLHLFCAVGNNGTIITSPDGVTWTFRTNTKATDLLKSVTYANGQFVAVSTNSALGGFIYTSPDGITWTVNGLRGPVNNSFNQVLFSGNFLIVENTGM